MKNFSILLSNKLDTILTDNQRKVIRTQTVLCKVITIFDNVELYMPTLYCVYNGITNVSHELNNNILTITFHPGCKISSNAQITITAKYIQNNIEYTASDSIHILPNEKDEKCTIYTNNTNLIKLSSSGKFIPNICKLSILREFAGETDIVEYNDYNQKYTIKYCLSTDLNTLYSYTTQIDINNIINKYNLQTVPEFIRVFLINNKIDRIIDSIDIPCDYSEFNSYNIVDLDNEMETIVVDSDYKLLSNLNLVTTASLYINNELLKIDLLHTRLQFACDESDTEYLQNISIIPTLINDNKNLLINIIAEKDNKLPKQFILTIHVAAYINNSNKDYIVLPVDYTVNTIPSGQPIYELLLNTSAIRSNIDGTVEPITVEATKVMKVNSILENTDYGLILYAIDDEDEASVYDIPLNSKDIKKCVKFEYIDNDGNLLDAETIFVIYDNGVTDTDELKTLLYVNKWFLATTDNILIPTYDDAWVQDDIPDTWNADRKYCWMYEEYVYVKNNGDEYIVKTTPFILAIYATDGKQGERGDKTAFAFMRTNTRPGTPIGGTFDNPVPTNDNWTSTIPDSSEILWMTTRVFNPSETVDSSLIIWNNASLQTDTATLDIEFSDSSTLPPIPSGAPFTDRSEQGWYDADSSYLNGKNPIWRAERTVYNGKFIENKPWVITKIAGGEDGYAGCIIRQTEYNPALERIAFYNDYNYHPLDRNAHRYIDIVHFMKRWFRCIWCPSTNTADGTLADTDRIWEGGVTFPAEHFLMLFDKHKTADEFNNYLNSLEGIGINAAYANKGKAQTPIAAYLCWEEITLSEPIVTPLIIALNAILELALGNEFLMLDLNNNIVGGLEGYSPNDSSRYNIRVFVGSLITDEQYTEKIKQSYSNIINDTELNDIIQYQKELAPFRIYDDGSFYANNANIQGELKHKSSGTNYEINIANGEIEYKNDGLQMIFTKHLTNNAPTTAEISYNASDNGTDSDNDMIGIIKGTSERVVLPKFSNVITAEVPCIAFTNTQGKIVSYLDVNGFHIGTDLCNSSTFIEKIFTETFQFYPNIPLSNDVTRDVDDPDNIKINYKISFAYNQQIIPSGTTLTYNDINDYDNPIFLSHTVPYNRIIADHAYSAYELTNIHEFQLLSKDYDEKGNKLTAIAMHQEISDIYMVEGSDIPNIDITNGFKKEITLYYKSTDRNTYYIDASCTILADSKDNLYYATEQLNNITYVIDKEEFYNEILVNWSSPKFEISPSTNNIINPLGLGLVDSGMQDLTWGSPGGDFGILQPSDGGNQGSNNGSWDRIPPGSFTNTEDRKELGGTDNDNFYPDIDKNVGGTVSGLFTQRSEIVDTYWGNKPFYHYNKGISYGINGAFREVFPYLLDIWAINKKIDSSNITYEYMWFPNTYLNDNHPLVDPELLPAVDFSDITTSKQLEKHLFPFLVNINFKEIRNAEISIRDYFGQFNNYYSSIISAVTTNVEDDPNNLLYFKKDNYNKSNKVLADKINGPIVQWKTETIYPISDPILFKTIERNKIVNNIIDKFISDDKYEDTYGSDALSYELIENNTAHYFKGSWVDDWKSELVYNEEYIKFPLEFLYIENKDNNENNKSPYSKYILYREQILFEKGQKKVYSTYWNAPVEFDPATDTSGIHYKVVKNFKPYRNLTQTFTETHSPLFNNNLTNQTISSNE